MERKDFLKGLGLIGLGTIALPIVGSCSKDDTNKIMGGMPNQISSSCGDTSPIEEEGPFPTHSPASYVTNDIRSDRTGVPFTINIHIKNFNASNAALEGALIDIWHCDREGNYSEYGGSGMQSTNYTAVHFLRGRQTTDANGLVTYTSVFPGWYSGRATHIHVHIYNAAGNSLLITQIGFPDDSSSAVVAVNALSGYKGMNGYSYNTTDQVFSDTITCEIATVTGNVIDGYTLDRELTVAV